MKTKHNKGNKILLTFILLTLLGIIVRFLGGENSILWSIWNVVDVSFAVSLGILAFIAYKDMIREDDEISIYIKVNNNLINTGLIILRQDCTRSEVQGLFGMIQKDSSFRYNITYMKKRAFLKNLHKIKKGKSKKLIIPLTTQEFEQFKVLK